MKSGNNFKPSFILFKAQGKRRHRESSIDSLSVIECAGIT